MGMTQILSQEHQVVLGKLDRLEGSLQGPDVSGVEEVLRFMENDLVLHRRKEEEVLFPALAKQIGVEGGPIGVMLSEHSTEKELLTDLRAAVDSAKAGKDTKDEIRGAAQGILDLLRPHIQKEDNILYPMAEQILSPEEQAAVARGMAEIGTFYKEETHE